MGLILVHFVQRRKKMTHEEFKDRLFEILDETDKLPIADIDTNDKDSEFKVVLKDRSQFIVSTKPHGTLFIMK